MLIHDLDDNTALKAEILYLISLGSQSICHEITKVVNKWSLRKLLARNVSIFRGWVSDFEALVDEDPTEAIEYLINTSSSQDICHELVALLPKICLKLDVNQKEFRLFFKRWFECSTVELQVRLLCSVLEKA